MMLEIHLRRGNVGGTALEQYECYRDLLQHQLGIEPGLRVTTLVGQYIRRNRLRIHAGCLLSSVPRMEELRRRLYCFE